MKPGDRKKSTMDTTYIICPYCDGPKAQVSREGAFLCNSCGKTLHIYHNIKLENFSFVNQQLLAQLQINHYSNIADDIRKAYDEFRQKSRKKDKIEIAKEVAKKRAIEREKELKERREKYEQSDNPDYIYDDNI